MVAVGQLSIDFTPPPVKNFAISAFGSHDKVVLVGGILVVLAIFAAVIGVLAMRRLAYGMTGLGVFTLVGLIAALTRPGASASDALPTLVGGVAAVLALRRLARAAQRRRGRLRPHARAAGPARPPGPSGAGGRGPARPARAARLPRAGAPGASGSGGSVGARPDAGGPGRSDRPAGGPAGPPGAGRPGWPAGPSGAGGPAGPAVPRSGADAAGTPAAGRPAGRGGRAAGQWTRRRRGPRALAARREPPAPPPPRRSFIATSAVVAGTAVVAGIGGRLLGERASVSVGAAARCGSRRRSGPPRRCPAGANLKIPGLSSFITPNASSTGWTPRSCCPRSPRPAGSCGSTAWSTREMTLTFDDLIRRPLIEDYITLTCVSNPVGGPYIGNAKWLGRQPAQPAARGRHPGRAPTSCCAPPPTASPPARRSR